jgi:hypothetical protein
MYIPTLVVHVGPYPDIYHQCVNLDSKSELFVDHDNQQPMADSRAGPS